MSRKKLVTSAASRMVRLGGLAGRVGVSMAGNTMANLFRDDQSRQERQSANMMKNAMRIKEALGELKGVPMKVGQMLSLHENLLPPEVSHILQTLQQKAPSAPFEDILEMIQHELGDRFDEIAHIERNPLAAASIGQVHRAVLKDGREIVLKAQYPGIDAVIRSDLRNLKGIMRMVFFMFTRADIDEMWQETRDRLIEELDYEHEAQNMRKMAEFLKDDPRIRIPGVIDHLTTRHVLAMEKVIDISPDQATSDAYPAELKDKWGRILVSFTLKGLFDFRFLHADPNLSNFAFREDGGIVVYDFGCMKEMPEELSRHYVRLTDAVLDHNYPAIPELLKSMGVFKADGSPVPWEMVKDYADELQNMFSPDRAYTFGVDGDIYKRLQVLGQKYIGEFMHMVFPKDLIFIDRTLTGHFGNLNRLKASADWRSLMIQHMKEAYPDETLSVQ